MPSRKLEYDVLIQTVNLYQQYGSLSAAANALGIPRKTFAHRYHLAEKAGLIRNEFEVESIPTGDIPIEELLDGQAKKFLARREYEQAAKLINVKIKIDGPIGILHFGDPHVDDDGTDIIALRDHAELVRKTPGLFGGNIGDTSNNWAGRLARLYAEQSTSAHEAWRIAEWFLNTVDWLYIIGGNHDAWSGAGDPIKWITQYNHGVHQMNQARIGLNFPNGKLITINAHHNWPGNSQFNKAHGQMKAAQRGYADDIIISGHKHVTGYGVVKNPQSGLISHCIQLGSYKIYDRYAKELGLDDSQISPSVVTIIDPDANPEGRVHVFWDVEEGADYLNYKRSKL